MAYSTNCYLGRSIRTARNMQDYLYELGLPDGDLLGDSITEVIAGLADLEEDLGQHFNVLARLCEYLVALSKNQATEDLTALVGSSSGNTGSCAAIGNIFMFQNMSRASRSVRSPQTSSGGPSRFSSRARSGFQQRGRSSSRDRAGSRDASRSRSADGRRGSAPGSAGNRPAGGRGGGRGSGRGGGGGGRGGDPE